ncbi:M23 family metallopeptidase [Actinomyces faecalis]|uniref:M23 family metallopeptidase n=1 Tax=Actinomyces faecalis TaxID=2722820 RepID=UPI001FD51B7B|nr:M23 family metallopeptidase [Actinomyces faecalis]
MSSQPMTRRQRRDAERAALAAAQGPLALSQDDLADPASADTEDIPPVPQAEPGEVPPAALAEQVEREMAEEPWRPAAVSPAELHAIERSHHRRGGRRRAPGSDGPACPGSTATGNGRASAGTWLGMAGRAGVLVVLASVTVLAPLGSRLSLSSAASASVVAAQAVATSTATAAASSVAAAVLGSDADLDESTDAALSNVPDAATLARIREAYVNAQTCTVQPVGASGDTAAFAQAPQVVNPMVAGTYTVSSDYGYRIHPTLGYLKLHAGQDYAAAVGTPIYAAAAGKVVTAGMSSDGTGTVVIEHKLDGETWYTSYLHMYEDGIYVHVGDEVSAGQLIAGVGSTGRSTGAHLHFEVRTANDSADETTVNPSGWLAEHGAAELTSSCL